MNINAFIHLNSDWSLHIRSKTEIQLIMLVREQVKYLISQQKFIEAITYLKYTLMFCEDEPSILEEIADLYEHINQPVEALKWREKAGELH